MDSRDIEVDLQTTPLQQTMKLVIIGAGGRLGSALAREYREKFYVIGFDHAQLDLQTLMSCARNCARPISIFSSTPLRLLMSIFVRRSATRLSELMRMRRAFSR